MHLLQTPGALLTFGLGRAAFAELKGNAIWPNCLFLVTFEQLLHASEGPLSPTQNIIATVWPTDQAVLVFHLSTHLKEENQIKILSALNSKCCV